MIANKNTEQFFLTLINDGKISLDRTGKCFNTKTGNENGTSLHNGYYRIRWEENKIEWGMKMHRLIYLHFNGQIPDNYVINHKDGNKSNNHIGNLEAITKSENNKHAHTTGLINKDKHKKAINKSINRKFNNQQISEIIELCNSKKYTQREIAKIYNTSQQTISAILTGKIYTNFEDKIITEIPPQNIPITKIEDIKGKYSENEKFYLQLVINGELRCTPNGNVYRYNTNTWIGALRKDGYCILTINAEEKRICMLIHRLIYMVFNGPIPENYKINHKDGNKSNNHKDNLETTTDTENTQHAYDIGLTKSLKGEKHSRTKLTDNDVIKIRQLRKIDGLSYPEILKIYNITYAALKSILLYRNWKHLE